MAVAGLPASLGALFAGACRQRGPADFLVDEAHRYTGMQALEASAVAAGALARAGIGPGDRVAFLTRTSARHALAWFACIRLGAVPVNMHVLDTDQRLGRAFAWLEATALVGDAEFAARAESLAPARTLSLDALFDGAPATDLDTPRWDDDGAIILSSGSTGEPKGAVHGHAGLVFSSLNGAAIYGRLTARDAVIVALGNSFAGWNNTVLPFIAAGALLVFRQKFQADDFLATLAAERITVAPLVPTAWRMVLAAGPEKHDLSSLRAAFFSGEPGQTRDIQALARRICPNVMSAYLSTEGACAAGIVADERDFLGAGKPDCAGRPVPGATLRIVAADGSVNDVLPPGTVGEICLQGPSTALRYWRDEALSTKRFVQGLWRSGDLGEVDDEGLLFIRGRVDNLINSGGIKVHAEEVEAALLRHADVRQVAVVGVADAQWGQRIEAHVVAAPGLTAEALLAWCRADGALPALKLPKVVHLVATLPTGPTGKLYRRGLRT